MLLIVKEIFDFLVELNYDCVDTEKSTMKYIEETSCYQIGLRAKNGDLCDLFFEISEDNVVNINIGKGYGEYLFSQDILNLQDIYKLRNTLRNLFTNSIEENLIFCNDKLTKCEYTIMCEIDGKNLPYHFASNFGSCWFWQMKWDKKNIYNAWLNKKTE